MNYIKQNHLSILIILWLVLSSFGGSGTAMFGASPQDLTTVGNPVTFTNTKSPGGVTLASTTVTSLKVGQSATALANIVSTTCDPIANTSVAATSTTFIYCTGVQNVTSSDYVFASFSTTTGAIGTQWAILGAKASTTAGAVDIKIMNLTGTAAVPSAAAGAQFASSTRLLIIR